jgi:O-antigen ligase
MMNLANLLALAAWVLLSWRGGLMDWQAPLGALLGLAALWLGRPTKVRPMRLSLLELGLGGLILAYGILGLAGARPQAGLNQALVLAGLFCLALQWRRNGPGSEAVAWTWMAMAAAATLVFFAAGWLQPPRWPEDLVGPLLRPHLSSRWVAPNQNLLGACLSLPALLLGLSGLAQGWAGWRRGLALASVILACLCCVYIGSRGVWLATAVSLAWLCARWRRPGWQRLALAAVVTVLALSAGALWAPFSTSRLRADLQADAKQADPNNGRRVDFWKGSLRLSLEHPLSGWGGGSFSLEALRLNLPTALDEKHPIARYRLGLDHAHNDWLELAVEGGWPLAMAWAALALWWLWRRFRRQDCSGTELGLEAAVVAALVFSLNDMNLRTPGPLFGLVLVLAVLEPRAQEGELPWPRWIGPCLGGLCLAALVGWWQAQTMHRDLRSQTAVPAWRPWLVQVAQPLDGEAAAWRQDSGAWAWPWDAWAGRFEPAWWWSCSAKAGLAGDAGTGITDTLRALDLRPYDAPAWFLYGMRQQSMGNLVGAGQAVKHSLLLEPHYVRALAWSCDQALARADKALANQYFDAALQASRLQMTDDVLDDYSRSLQSIDPDWFRTRAKRLGRKLDQPGESQR